MAKTRVRLELKGVKRAIAVSLKQADRAVKMGKRHVAAAKRAGDPAALKANLKALKNAEQAQRQLPAVIRALEGACCNQEFDCDPSFES